MVHCFFDIPFVDAARVLGVCVGTLRNIRDWTGHSFWPFKSISEGRFEMKRDEIVVLRRSIIERLCYGEDVRLPMLLEAERLSPIFKTITTPTKFAFSARVKVMLLNPEVYSAQNVQRPSKSAMAVKRSGDVFKRFTDKRRVHWKSIGDVAGGTEVRDEMSVEGKNEMSVEGKDEPSVEGKDEPSVEGKDEMAVEGQSKSPPFCPLSYVKDCVTPSWITPEYPPVSEITDGVGAFWPVMDDPRRFLIHDLLYKRFPSRPVGPSYTASAPLSVADSRVADGFLKKGLDSH